VASGKGDKGRSWEGGRNITKKAQNGARHGDNRTNVWVRERRITQKGQALLALSESPLNSILYVSPPFDSFKPFDSIGLNVLAVSCVSVNCVVVVDRKTIGPFERAPLVVRDFEGIEYDIDWAARVSSELIPRPIRTMISENCVRGEQGKVKNK
jgi:hypothetical protein